MMDSEVTVDSFSTSKSAGGPTRFKKYDVEATINEIENLENYSVFKYSFTILSDPKNIRTSVGGITKIFGKQTERDKVLEKNENDVPRILSLIYQELFPMFFTMSKSLAVPCPPYQIVELAIPSKDDVENISQAEESTNIQTPQETLEKAEPTDPSDFPPKDLETSDDFTDKFKETSEGKPDALYQQTSPERTEGSSDEQQVKLDDASKIIDESNDGGKEKTIS